MRLYLCRHAEAVDRAGESPLDEDRWLTEHGRRQAQTVGKALREGGVKIDALFTSPLVRAVQTAEGLAHGLRIDGEVEILRPLAPGGTLGELLTQLVDLAGAREDIAVVGHEPQMSEWAARLLGIRVFDRAFKKGAVLGLEWKKWPEPGSGRGLFFMTPKGLKLEPLPDRA